MSLFLVPIKEILNKKNLGLIVSEKVKIIHTNFCEKGYSLLYFWRLGFSFTQ
jgi:hypothetical protein